ncbi:MAG: hypothetical protein JST84_28455 [Acidobacteria bacterium]|nr:hypothetical protein [Acidobacteriota bacterium]
MIQRTSQSFLLMPGEEVRMDHLYARWIAANALGEMIGLGLVAAIAGGMLWYFGEPRTSLAVLCFTALTILLGAGEGLILGYAQWYAMHPFMRRLPRCDWMKATAIGAVIAWGLGMIPSTLIALQETAIASPPAEISPIAKFSLAALMGLGLGVALGMTQWLILRKYLKHTNKWITANAFAWAVGMPLVFVGAGVIPQGTQGLPIFFLIAVTLLITGAVVGAIHGLVLIGLLRDQY